MVSFEHLLFMYEVDDFNIEIKLIDGFYYFRYTMTINNEPLSFGTSINKMVFESGAGITPEIVMKKDIITMFKNWVPSFKRFGNIDFDDYEFPNIDKSNLIDLTDDEIL